MTISLGNSLNSLYEKRPVAGGSFLFANQGLAGLKNFFLPQEQREKVNLPYLNFSCLEWVSVKKAKVILEKKIGKSQQRRFFFKMVIKESELKGFLDLA